MNSKIKYIYLIIGIVIGIAIGGSCVWWIQNYDLKIWFSFSGKKQLLQKGNDMEIDTSITNSKTKTITANNFKKTDNNKKESSNKDTLNMNSNNKSSNNDTVNLKRADDNIVVVKDEMIYSKYFKVEGLTDNNTRHDAILDSLLIDDKNTKHLPSNVMHVEFWKSPVNYKGYKFNNNRLILFGVYQYDFATFEFKNGSLYLNYLNTSYRIDKTDDFKQLLSIKKPTIKPNKN